MRSVHTNTQRQLLTAIHNCPQMLEAMADAFALARGVLQQNFELAESQTFTRDLQAEGANLQSILFRTTARAAGMHDQVINAERNRPLNFFAERIDGFQQNDFIGGREIDQVVRVNEYRRESCLLERPAKKRY